MKIVIEITDKGVLLEAMDLEGAAYAQLVGGVCSIAQLIVQTKDHMKMQEEMWGQPTPPTEPTPEDNHG